MCIRDRSIYGWCRQKSWRLIVTARTRVKKYHFKLFMYPIDIVCFNSFQLYKTTGVCMDRLWFLIVLFKKLVEQNLTEVPWISIQVVGSPSLKPMPTRLVEKHFPDLIPSSDKSKSITRRCSVCYKKGLRGKSLLVSWLYGGSL